MRRAWATCHPAPSTAMAACSSGASAAENRRERGRETVQERLHGFGRDARQHEREALAGGGPHRREQVRPGVALIAQARRTLAAAPPAVAHAPLLAKAHLVLEPERQALAGVLGRDAVQFALKPP